MTTTAGQQPRHGSPPLRACAWMIATMTLPLTALAADETSFVAKTIELDGIHAAVTIQSGSGPAIQWHRSKSGANAFTAQLVNGVLRLTGKPDQSIQGGVSVETRNGVTVVESGSGNRVSVNVGGHGTAVHVQSKPLPRLELVVPHGTAIRARQASGQWEIGDLGGRVEFGLLTGEATIGRIGAAVLKLDGAGTIRVAHVQGSLKADVEGSGSLEVATSQLDRLDVNLSGTGDIHIGGVARQAKVSLHGTGNIEVDKVLEKPVVVMDGVGDIQIGGW